MVKSLSQAEQGPMAQLGARLNGIEKVVGSSPTRSTGNYKTVSRNAGCFHKKQTPLRLIDSA